MQFFCPFCQNPSEVERDPPPEEIDCDVCGSRFPSEPERTVEFELGRVVEFAHFELLEEVGAGAYGSVWRARDTRLDRIVAVKIPRRDRLTPEEADRFLMEAQTAAQLRHQGIVSIHDTGYCGTTAYIATDFVDGMTLDNWMDARPVSPPIAAEVCAQVADSLHHAHEAGIIHRDVKPSNIIMDKEEHPWITDFGLAKRESVDTTIATEGSLLGTPAYMSPEQARGEAHWADRRSDIYSLGVILFQMLTGERPFRGSRDAILRQVLESEAPQTRRLNSNVPEDLDTICMKCLEKEPSQRYGSTSELADELRRFLRGEPIRARPITRARRAWRWCRRNPAIATLAASLLIISTVSLYAILSQWQRANRNSVSALSAAAAAERSAESAVDARDKSEQYLYVANLNLTQQAYELADPERMMEILTRHVPKETGDKDRRGFAWRYWHRQAQRWRESMDLDEIINATGISADGAITAVGGSSGIIKLFDTVTGRKRGELKGHQRQVFAIAFSPSDPDLLVSIAGDQTLRFWSIDQRKETRQVPLSKSAFAIDISDDGESFAIAGADQSVQLWDIQGDEPRTSMKGHYDFVYDVDISRDGKLVASGGLDRMVRIWDAESGEQLHALEGHDLEVWGVAFSPDSRRLASGGDVTVRIWDVESGAQLTSLSGHTGRIRCIKYSPDGNLLVSCGHDRTIRFWDMTAESRPLDVPKRNADRREFYFFERMRLPNDDFPKDTFVGHNGDVTDLAWSRNGKTLASVSVDGTAKLWSIAELDRKQTLSHDGNTISVVSVGRDGRTMISGGMDRTARLWDVATMRQISEPMNHDGYVYAAAISPDGRSFATGDSTGMVSLGQLTGSVRVPLKGHTESISTVVFSPNSKRLASASRDGTVRLWDVETAQSLPIYEGHTKKVQAVVFISDDTVASAGADGEIRIWNVFDRTTSRVLTGHTDTIWALALSPDRRHLASTGYDRTIRLWDLSSEESEPRVIDAHAETIRAVAFCPDGITLASAGDDNTIKLWDIDTLEPKTTFKDHESRVWSLTFAPKGDQLFSSSLKVRIWNAPSQRSGQMVVPSPSRD